MAYKFRPQRDFTVTLPSKCPRLLRLYHNYLREPQVWVFMDQVAAHYTLGTLGRLMESDSVPLRRASALAIGLLGHADHTNLLGPALRDTDRGVRLVAEHGIRELWQRGRNDAERRELACVQRMIMSHQFLNALHAATEFVLSSRWLAEAWYVRAQIRFRLHSYRHAYHDACKALYRDRYHFPAAILAGQAQLALGNERSAIQSFGRALRIYSDLEQVRVHVHRLKDGGDS